MVKKRWKSPRNRNADVSRAYERRSSIKSAGSSGAIKFTDLKNSEFYFQIQAPIDRAADSTMFRLRTNARRAKTSATRDSCDSHHRDARCFDFIPRVPAIYYRL